MSYKDKLINSYQDKLNTDCSDMERLVYTEAITLIVNDVNVDKVKNWVNSCVRTFNNKPQPLSEKEKLKRKQKSERKVALKVKKEQTFNSLNEKMKSLIEELDVKMIGFFDWKEIKEDEYNFLTKLLKSNGYIVTDYGDGAYEPIVSTKPIDKTFYNTYRGAECDLMEIYPNKDNSISDITFDEVKTFREGVHLLID